MAAKLHILPFIGIVQNLFRISPLLFLSWSGGLSCGDMRVSLSDLTSLHGQISYVFLIQPEVCSKPTRFSAHQRLDSHFLLFLWTVNCRTFLVDSELCVIVHLRAFGRKFDAGQCGTRGAVRTLPPWESSADAALPSTRPGLLPQRRRPFNIRLLFMCFVILQNWNCRYRNFELPMMWTPFNLNSFVQSSNKSDGFDRFHFMLDKSHFSPLKSDLHIYGEKKHTIVGFCVKLLIVWFSPVWIT